MHEEGPRGNARVVRRVRSGLRTILRIGVRMADERVGKRLLRSVGLGLVAAFGIAAVVLLVLAVVRLNVDCAGMGAEECNFEKALASGIARLQTFAALGMGILAGGLFLFLRRSRAQ